MTTIGSCRSCLYFSRPGSKLGDCRVNPPVATDDETARWPAVWAADWCGSYKKGRP